MKLKVFTAFSGYDSQCMALDRLHQNNPYFTYELVGWAEIDKYVIQAHNAVYPQWAERNYGDISKIDWAQVPDFDLFTYSSPCQDFSQAGKQAGGTEGSGTRSSLLWECRRAILAKRPKYLLMENVAALVSKKFIRLFNAWQLELESYGYSNFAKVLNAKDYGVPQNRERIFMVSVLDETARYEFPAPMQLTIRLKDVLEKEVEERYYLKDEKIIEIAKSTSAPSVQVVADLQPENQWQGVTRQQNHVISHNGISMAITAEHARHEFKITEPHVLGWSRSSNGKGEVISRHPVKVANCVTAGKRDNTQNYVVEPQINVVGELHKGQSGTIYGTEGVSPTICAGEGIKCNTKIAEPINTDTDGCARTINAHYECMNADSILSKPKDGYGFVRTAIKEFIVPEPMIGAFRGRNPENPSERGRSNGMYKQRLEINENGQATPLTGVQKDNMVVEYGFRIRKLTERECFRLMDVPEEYIDRLMSDTGFIVYDGKKYVQVPRLARSRLYKMAGNSIVVACLYYIFDKLFIHTTPTELTLF